jgi:hypothetical protein
MKDNDKLRRFLDKFDEDPQEEIDPVIAAYTAGMIDADGSIGMLKGESNYRRPIVTVYNNDFAIMEKLQIAWGGKITKREFDNPKWNDSYEIRFNTTESLHIIEAVLPYLSHTKKKARARLLDEHYIECTPRNGKYTNQQKEQKRWLEEEVMSIQMRG